MKVTHSLVQVASAIMDKPNQDLWGYELSRAAGVRSGVLYPILHRMLDEGWLEDGWEEHDPGEKKRPPRRYYRLTETGARELGGILRTAQHDARFSALKVRFA